MNNPTSQIEEPILAVVGYKNEPDCHNLRDFLACSRVPFTWLDPKKTELHFPHCPVVVYPDGGHAVKPTLREVAEKLGMTTQPSKEKYDLVIVGAGPAGLAAAVNGASEGLDTLLIECRAPGGQAGTSSRIENYLGFPIGLSGDELASRAVAQAERLGAEVLRCRQVTGINTNTEGLHGVELDWLQQVEARAVVLATGVAWRKLQTDGADRLLGRGLYYGAARTEALSVKGRNVFLVGGGNSAGQAAMLFAQYAAEVTVLVRGPNLTGTMSQYLIGQLGDTSNVNVWTGCEIKEFHGEDSLEYVSVYNKTQEDMKKLQAAAVFVFIGADADTKWMPETIVRDRGFIVTGSGCGKGRLLETSVPGIFCAGDVRFESVKRVAAAAGEGSMAVAFIHQYLKEKHG